MKPFQIDIEPFVLAAQAALLGASPIVVTYHDLEDLANNKHPDEIVGRKFNLYALWSHPSGQEDWQLMYIGERHSSAGVERLGQHLFKVPRGTQSKLAEVRAVLAAGGRMGVTAALVQPESMRLAIEEELLRRNSSLVGQLPWNKKGVIHPKQRLRPATPVPPFTPEGRRATPVH